MKGNTESVFFPSNFKKAYAELYALHPSPDETDFRFRYLKTDWFFPNHINNVLTQIKELGNKYFQNIDLQVALYGGLFHDAGLVYKRESADPSGHEDRSVQYAQKELKKLGYKQVFIDEVSECIRATNPSYSSELPEALLVRNADAYAHITSMHFFAKANFTYDIHVFINWFEKKNNSTYSKITIPEIKQKVQPLIEYYEEIIKNYQFNRDSKDFLSNVLENV